MVSVATLTFNWLSLNSTVVGMRLVHENMLDALMVRPGMTLGVKTDAKEVLYAHTLRPCQTFVCGLVILAMKTVR